MRTCRGSCRGTSVTLGSALSPDDALECDNVLNHKETKQFKSVFFISFFPIFKLSSRAARVCKNINLASHYFSPSFCLTAL